jgi:hypothetical protein
MSVTTPPRRASGPHVGLGRQLDIQPVTAGGVVTDIKVAAYVAK